MDVRLAQAYRQHIDTRLRKAPTSHQVLQRHQDNAIRTTPTWDRHPFGHSQLWRLSSPPLSTPSRVKKTSRIFDCAKPANQQKTHERRIASHLHSCNIQVVLRQRTTHKKKGDLILQPDRLRVLFKSTIHVNNVRPALSIVVVGSTRTIR